MSKHKNSNKNQHENGFTLIEILIVSVIIGMLSMMLFFNFRSSNSGITALNQTVAAVTSDIRRAQSMAINSTLFQGQVVCGYGIHYVGGNNNYLIYVRVKPVGISCDASGNRNYNQSSDAIVQNIFLANQNMKIAATCQTGNGSNAHLAFSGNDIFFEPPDPKTYINNDATLGGKSVDIFIDINSVACNVAAAIVNVTTAGSINVQ